MMKKSAFVKLAKNKYGDKFDYSHLPEFIIRAPETIICKEHGKIEMIPRDHLRSKYGCPYCASIEVKKSSIDYNQETIEKAKKKFNGKFNYSDVDLNTVKLKNVEIKCPIHGSFLMPLHQHLHSDNGCRYCGREEARKAMTKYKDLNTVARKANLIHNGIYRYTNYDINTGILEFICSKHGKVTQLLSSHLTGRGCSKCGYENRTITPDEFLSRAKEVHPEGYTYDLSELTTVNHKITIEHSCGHVYKGRVSNHLSGQGCSRCKSSLGERKIAQFLDKHSIEYISQFRLDGYSYWYDFCLPELSVLIEYDGEQHFRPVDHFGGEKGFEQLKCRDRIKNNLATLFDYKLIRISYKYFDNIEVCLSRAIDRHFKYRVNGVFYKSFTSICRDLNLPSTTSARSLDKYRTFRILSPSKQ